MKLNLRTERYSSSDSSSSSEALRRSSTSAMILWLVLRRWRRRSYGASAARVGKDTREVKLVIDPPGGGRGDRAHSSSQRVEKRCVLVRMCLCKD